MLERLQRRWR